MRDKLVELIEEAAIQYLDAYANAGKIADFLIANGVTFAEDNNVPRKKPVLYSVTRGALCPACDGNLDIKVTVKKFLRKEKRVTLRQQSNCCKHCGQPLDWGNEPPKEGE
jgi:hypothetical protein